jgi:copper homeostasis protein
MDEMLEQMERFQSLDVHGFVFGCLTILDQIDLKNSKILLKKSGYKRTTFHRAFDHVIDKNAALIQLVRLGFDSVLTSGCIGPAIYGLDALSDLIDLAQDQIDIIIGGGVTPENIETILSKVSSPAYHASLSVSSGIYDGTEKVRRLKKAIEVKMR